MLKKKISLPRFPTTSEVFPMNRGDIGIIRRHFLEHEHSYN